MVTSSAVQFLLLFLLLAPGQLTGMSVPSASGTCPPETSMCLDGSQCFSDSVRCDGNEDCNDGTDEYDCEKHSSEVESSENNYSDSTHKSILDPSDSLSSEAHSSENLISAENKVTCPEDSALCNSSDQCIKKHQWCDRFADCADGSDEHDCATTCDGGRSFNCGNGRCIGNELHCNGNDDCGDSSDEVGCSVDMNCSPEEFVCPDGTCLAPTRVCDGIINCVGGSDEKEPCPPPHSSAEIIAPETVPGTQENSQHEEFIPGSTTITFNNNGKNVSTQWACIDGTNCNGGPKIEGLMEKTPDMEHLMTVKLQILEQERSNQARLYKLQVKELLTKIEAARVELKAAEAWRNAMLERLHQQREEHRLSIEALLEQPISLSRNQTEQPVIVDATTATILVTE